MGIMDRLQALKEQAARMLLEPERVDAWVTHLAECGFQGEVESRLQLDDVLRYSRIPRLCLARIRIHGRPIDCIELVKFSSSSGTSTTTLGTERSETRFNYKDHFIIELPERRLADPPRARRKPKRAYWLFGKILAYQWRGQCFAEQLAADTALNEALTQSGEGKIIVKYYRSENCIRIVRPYVGMTRHVESGLLRFHANIETHHHLPTPQALGAYEQIARMARSYAGLSPS